MVCLTLRAILIAGLVRALFAANIPKNPNCSVPVLSIGQTLNSTKDVNKLVKKHKHVLIAFAAPSCVMCCHWEPIYNNTVGLLPKSVHWARVDLDRIEAKSMASTYDLDVLPAAVFFLNKKPIKLLEVHRTQTLLGITERALTPLPVLQAESSEYEKFFDASQNFGSPVQVLQGKDNSYVAQLVRVVAFIDKNVEEEDLEELTEGARAFAGRPLSFRFGQVLDAATRKAIMSMVPSAFVACDSVAKQGRALLVLSLFDGEYVEQTRVVSGADALGTFAIPIRKSFAPGSLIFDAKSTQNQSASAEDNEQDTLSDDTLHIVPRVSCRAFDSYDGSSIEQWALRASLPPVGRFDATTSHLYEKTAKPFLMLFADTRHADMPALLRLLWNAQAHYNKDELKLQFVYIDGTRYLHRMTSLGLVADAKRLPALCFNYVTESVLTWQPAAVDYSSGAAKLTAEVIDSLVQRYFHGDGSQFKEEAAPKSLPVPKRNMDKGEQRSVPSLDTLSLEERLRFVTALNQESFSDIVLDSSYDVAVYLYSSSGAAEKSSTDAAIYVNRCAERFVELGIKTAKIVRLDMARFSTPPQVQISEVPSLVFFPAFSKDPPHQMFRGKFKVQHVLWWMQESASRPFDLPELPHLDEIESKAYWEQKAALPMERQKKIAVESETSARRAALQKQSRSKGRSSAKKTDL